MKLALIAVLAAVSFSAQIGSALAAATDWVEEEGARIRLVAAEPAAGETEIKAALQIELKDGWKTYWRDPGDAGVPPQISVTGAGISGFEMNYPAPERFHDGKSVWAGYKHMVAFPLMLKTAADMPKYQLKATTFLGICQDICIPVQTTFTLDVPQATGSTEDQSLVVAFFDALPTPATPDFGLAGMKRSGESVEIEMKAPDGAGGIELFLAADGFMFGTPEPKAGAAGTDRLAARIIFAPKNAAETQVFYTIKSDKGTVSGTVALAGH